MPGCNCPPFGNRNFRELVEYLEMGTARSKQCCNQAGYICSTLDEHLRKLKTKEESYNRLQKKTGYVRTPKSKEVRKKKLEL